LPAVPVEPAPVVSADPSVESPPAASTGARIARVVLGLIAGLGVAALAAWWMGVRPAEVARHVAGVSPWIVVFCLLSALVELAFQALRWHLVMHPLLGLSYAQAYRAQVVGQMFNAILPARGGDLLRVQYLGRRSGKPRAVILGTEVVDRWLDWWGWIPVLGVTSLLGGLPRWMYTAGGIFASMLVTWGTVMLILARRGWQPKPGSRLSEAWASFNAGIKAFRSKRTLVIGLCAAPLPWLWEICALIVAAKGFGIDLSFRTAFCVLIGFNLAMVVPSPGAIGTVEAGGTGALMFFGIDQSRALAFMVVYHFTQLLPSIAGGVGILVAEGEQLFGRAKPAAAAAPAPSPPAEGA
jgi:glycosyltransferase 2 family protein